MKGTRNAAYEALLQVAKAAGLPTTFRTDLTKHDRETIARHPGRSFAWILREGGTNLMWSDVVANFGEYGTTAPAYVRCVMDTFSDVRGLYFWDGSQLLGSEHMSEAELVWLIHHSDEYGALPQHPEVA